MKNWKWLFLVVCLVMAFGFATLMACGDDDDDDDDDSGTEDDDDAVDDDDTADDDDAADDDTADDDDDTADDDDDFDWGDWWPPEAGISFVYAVTEWTANEYEFTATVVGDDEFEGGTYTKLTFGNLTKDIPIGVEAWYDVSTPGEAGFMGANMFWSDESLGSFVMDAPVYLLFNPNVGEPLVDSGTGTFSEPINGDVPLTMEVTATTLELDTTVTVPYGTVDHCFKVQVDIFEDFAHTWVDRNQSSILYVHRELGLVQVTGDFLFGFKVALKEVNAP